MNVLQRMLGAALVCSMVLVGVARDARAQDLTRVMPAQSRPIVLTNATVHTLEGKTIEGGVVWFDEGVIQGVMTGEEFRDLQTRVRWRSPGPELVDLGGLHVYPGLIGASTRLGLTEMAAIRASEDSREVGEITPEARAATAVNPDSTLIPVTRSAGVLTVGVVPVGGLIAGRASVIRLHGWTMPDLIVEPVAGVVVNWPFMRVVRGTGDDRAEDGQARRISEDLETLTRFFDAAAAYHRERSKDPARAVDQRMESVRCLFAGEDEKDPQGRRLRRPVLVGAQDVEQITSAVAFFASRSIDCVILGGRDADLCVTTLKTHNVPVILEGVHRLPKRADSAYDSAFTLPARLKEAGVRFAIASGERTAHERNLPHHAGTAAAFGLDAEDALAAITRWPAEILGVGDRLGSIGVGKAATLIMTDGSPLEITTRVVRAYIDGRAVDPSNKQDRLYEKYREKYIQRGDLPADAR